MAKAVKYLEGLTIHKVPYNIANTDSFRDNVMADAADNELFIITDTPTFSLKIGNVTYDGTSNVSVIDATESASGLMSAADKSKLNGIAKGATKVVVDTSLSGTSTNPVQNKVVKAELDKKFNKTGGIIDGYVQAYGGIYGSSVSIGSYELNDDGGGLGIWYTSNPAGVDPFLTSIRIGTPENNDEATTKKYVDDADKTILKQAKSYVDFSIITAINSTSY